MFQDRLEIAKCNICSQEIRREPLGATSKKISTKCLWGHLKLKHKNEHLLAEKERSKEAEKKRKQEEDIKKKKYEIGQQVLIKNHQLSNAEHGEIKKLFNLFNGPYEIIKIIK